MSEDPLEIGKNDRWDKKTRIYCVEKFIELKSPIRVQRAYKRDFKVRNAPSTNSISRWTSTFKDCGSVLDRHRRDSDEVKHSGRPKIRTEEVIQRVKESVEKSLKRSLNQRSQIIDLKRSTLRRVLLQDLNLFPYRLQVLHNLTELDKKKRLEMAEWFAEKTEKSPNWIRRVWFSDEAHFKLSGCVNSKNAIHWGSEKPDQVLQKPLHSVKCTAWVAISHSGIVGPFWFEDSNGKTETVNTQRYLEVLE